MTSTKTVWADCEHSPAPPVPDLVEEFVDDTQLNPAEWTLVGGTSPAQRELFGSWRAQFVTSVRVGEVAVVQAVFDAARRGGVDSPTRFPATLDQAGVTNLWWCAEDEATLDAFAPVVSALEQTAQTAREYGKNVTFRLR